MYIVMPLGGIGKRYKDEGYIFPKPLVRASGEKIINRVVSSLNMGNDDVLIIGYGKELEEYQFETVFLKDNPHLIGRVKFKVLDTQTRGAAETLLLTLNSFDLDESQPIISIDCDTAYTEDILNMFKQSGSNSIFYFEDEDDKPIYSYIKVDDNRVTAIQEKVKISTKACCGAYGFSSVYKCKDMIEKTIRENRTFNNEFYISCVYSTMLALGEKVVPLYAPNRICFGTPSELKDNVVRQTFGVRPKRFCFDLDGTIVTHPTVSGDYTTVLPIAKTIRLIRNLHANGNHITVYTARGMKSSGGDIIKVEDKHRKTIENTLQSMDVPYDDLVLGKPYADFYIDDLAVNTFGDMSKETGYYYDLIAPRDFNKLEITDQTVVKETANNGEIYWYSNAPKRVMHLIPQTTIISSNKICMEKINGITISQLYINNSLTKEQMSMVLDGLETFHTCSTHQDDNSIDITDLYTKKLIDRHQDMGEFSDHALFSILKSLLQDYCVRFKKNSLCVVHGDPVFTNIILDKTDCLKFFDMRGKIGDTCTLIGDPNYDYAKVYQSLMGYDHIISNREIDYTKIQRRIDQFSQYIIDKYGVRTMVDVQVIASYLLYCLIPLHKKHQDKFLNLSRHIITSIPKESLSCTTS